MWAAVEAGARPQGCGVASGADFLKVGSRGQGRGALSQPPTLAGQSCSSLCTHVSTWSCVSVPSPGLAASRQPCLRGDPRRGLDHTGPCPPMAALPGKLAGAPCLLRERVIPPASGVPDDPSLSGSPRPSPGGQRAGMLTSCCMLLARPGVLQARSLIFLLLLVLLLPGISNSFSHSVYHHHIHAFPRGCRCMRRWGLCLHLVCVVLEHPP